MPRSQRVALVGSVLCVLVLAVIATWPTHVDSGIDVVHDTIVGRWLLAQGLSASQVYELMQFWANVLLYLPLGIFTVLAATARTRWWHVVVLALSLSAAFELLQAAVRPGRTADLSDVVANT